MLGKCLTFKQGPALTSEQGLVLTFEQGPVLTAEQGPALTAEPVTWTASPLSCVVEGQCRSLAIIVCHLFEVRSLVGIPPGFCEPAWLTVRNFDHIS